MALWYERGTQLILFSQLVPTLDTIVINKVSEQHSGQCKDKWCELMVVNIMENLEAEHSLNLQYVACHTSKFLTGLLLLSPQ